MYPRIKSAAYVYKYELLLILLYFLTRLINLTLLPIFNDEAIYLHWGWEELYTPHNLYYSLFDGKQPLLMWIFGLSETFIKDPLVAGRTISVIFGFFSMLGIYLLGRRLFDQKIAVISAFFYCITPLFVFYDRQALMESSISCAGIWLLYLFLLMNSKPKITYAIASGIILGISLFIKSTPLIFLITLLFLSCFLLYKNKSMRFKKDLFQGLLITLYISWIILIPLYKQISYSKFSSLNLRYSYSLKDLTSHAETIIMSNTKATLELLFWFLTPLVFFLLIIGIILIIKNKSHSAKIVLSWFLLTLMFFILFTKAPSTRYITAFLPVSTLIIGNAAGYILKFNIGELYNAVSIYVLLTLTLLFLFNPIMYISLIGKFTHYSNLEYIHGWTSGYGIENAYNLLLNEAKKKKIKVAVRHDFGNPEDAMFVYLRNTKNISVSYIDFSCWDYQNTNNIPIYFVSRGGQFDGNEECLTPIKLFYKPDGNEFVGVYKVD